MEQQTLPIDLDERTRVLWEDVICLREQLARLAKTAWIQKHELEALRLETYALRLRVQELEEEKGLDAIQPSF